MTGMPSETVSPPSSAADRWRAWDGFLESTPATGFMQSSWWADFRATVGWRHFGVVLKDGEAIVGGAVVMRFSYARRRCFYYIPEGPVLPDDESAGGRVFEAVLDLVEDRRRTDREAVSHLRIEPRWARLPGFVSGFQATAEFMEPRNTLCVDLRSSDAAILAQMDPNGRYRIRLAQRHGVTVVEDTSEQGLADFLHIYQDTAERQRLRAKDPGYFRTLVALAAPARRASIFFAEYQGARLAAALVLYFGGRATYFFGGSLDKDRQVRAPYLLQLEIMRHAKAKGCDWYDLWGIAPADEPDHPWWNFSIFKRNFGGRDFSFVPTLDRVYDPAAYQDYLRRYS